MRVLRSADYRRMPWKNGGGETAEIAVSPPGALEQFQQKCEAALRPQLRETKKSEHFHAGVKTGNAPSGEFLWRLSMATVAGDGPFSSFPEVDRMLTVLDGNGMVLFVEGREPVLLDADSPPHAFAGDATAHARLVDGPIHDLNLMVRRGVAHHAKRGDLDELLAGSLPNGMAMIMALAPVCLTCDGKPMSLGRFDTAIADAAELSRATVDISAQAVLISVSDYE